MVFPLELRNSPSSAETCALANKTSIKILPATNNLFIFSPWKKRGRVRPLESGRTSRGHYDAINCISVDTKKPEEINSSGFSAIIHYTIIGYPLKDVFIRRDQRIGDALAGGDGIH